MPNPVVFAMLAVNSASLTHMGRETALCQAHLHQTGHSTEEVDQDILPMCHLAFALVVPSVTSKAVEDTSCQPIERQTFAEASFATVLSMKAIKQKVVLKAVYST